MIDYPETFAKLGAALVRTGKFDAKKLFVPDAMSLPSVPDNIPAEALAGSYGVVAGSPQGTGPTKLFNKLWDEAGGVANTSLTANTFDAGIMCFLAAVQANSTEPGAIRDKIRTVTQRRRAAIHDREFGRGAQARGSRQAHRLCRRFGCLPVPDNGDPSTSLYDIFQYKDGKQVTIEQVDVK